MIENSKKSSCVPEMINQAPIIGDLQNQKFKRGQKVKITGGNIYANYQAIIEYSYSQKYYLISQTDTKSYSLVVLEGNKPINSIAWVKENDLLLIDENIETGLNFINQYYQRGNNNS